jgi:guanylate kinase
MKPPILIISAPSGAGKNSFVAKILQDHPSLVYTVTYTTRQIRPGEREGHPYHFVSKEEFSRLVEQGFFVEHAVVHGNHYGTPLNQLEEAWAQGRTVIMDIDIQGARTFKSKYPESASIFILPPSIDALRERIIKRDGGAPHDLELRMENASSEIATADEFDYRLVNDDFDESYREFKKLVDSLLNVE